MKCNVHCFHKKKSILLHQYIAFVIRIDRPSTFEQSAIDNSFEKVFKNVTTEILKRYFLINPNNQPIYYELNNFNIWEIVYLTLVVVFF